MAGDDEWMKGLKGSLSVKPRVVDAPPPAVRVYRANLDTLPEEIVLLVCEHVAARRTTHYWSPLSRNYQGELAALRAVCRSLRVVATPLLVRAIELKTDRRAFKFYELLNGDSSYSFLGPPPDLHHNLKSLWSPNCVPLADIAPGPYASHLLMNGIRHLVIGPRINNCMPLDTRFILQLLPNLRTLEMWDWRQGDQMLDRAARVLRANVPLLERFVYAQGSDLQKFVTRNPFARALGDKEALREIELMVVHVGEAPWIYPEDVGFEQDLRHGDDEALGMDSRVVWYRPQLVFKEKQVQLPRKLRSLRFRNVTFDKPVTETPPPQTIDLLLKHAPHLLGISDKGKEKEIREHVWHSWPPAVHPFSRILKASASTLTELGLEGLEGTIPYTVVEHAMREIGPQLRKLYLRRYNRVRHAVKILAMCTSLRHLVMDHNGEKDREDETQDLLRAIPMSTRTLELFPPFALEHVSWCIEDGDLHVGVVDLQSDRWKPGHSAKAAEIVARAEEFGIEVLVGPWYVAPTENGDEEDVAPAQDYEDEDDDEDDEN